MTLSESSTLQAIWASKLGKVLVIGAGAMIALGCAAAYTLNKCPYLKQMVSHKEAHLREIQDKLRGSKKLQEMLSIPDIFPRSMTVPITLSHKVLNPSNDFAEIVDMVITALNEHSTSQWFEYAVPYTASTTYRSVSVKEAHIIPTSASDYRRISVRLYPTTLYLFFHRGESIHECDSDSD